MHASKRNGTVCAAVVVVLAAGLIGCPRPDTNWDRFTSDPVTETATLPAGGELAVRSDAGTVSIGGWDGDDVSVTYEKRVDIYTSPLDSPQDADEYLDLIEVTVTETDDGVTVVAGIPLSWPTEISASVDFDIQVPRAADLDIDVDAGTVTVEEVHGDMDVVVDAGTITIEHPDPFDEAQTLACAVDAGAILLEAPGDSDFVLEATATVGDVDVDTVFGVSVSRFNVVGARASGTVGAGGATVNLEVQAGSIQVDAD